MFGWVRGLWNRLTNAFGSVTVEITDNNDGWDAYTRSGGGPIDRNWPQRQEEFKDLLQAWRLNAWVRQVVRLITAYVIGDGVTVTSKDSDVQDFIDLFWNHPENLMDQRLSPWCDELTRAGELFPILFTNRIDGMSQVRIVPASQIETVETDPQDYEKETGYLEIVPGQIERRPWKSHRTAKPGRVDATGRRYRPDPMMLHYAVNKPVGATRGESDLTPLLPWAQRYVDWLKGRVMFNKIRNLMALVWVKLKDANQVQAKQNQYRTNPPGEAGILVTGPDEEIELLSANIEGSQSEQDGKALRLSMATAANLSLIHFGEGDTANRSTSDSMDDRTYRFFTQRQRDFGFFLCDLVGWAYRRYQQMRGRIIDRKEDLQISAKFPDISRSDNKELAEAAKAMVSSLAEMRREFPNLQNDEFDQVAVALAFKFAGELLPEDEIEKLLVGPSEQNGGQPRNGSNGNENGNGNGNGEMSTYGHTITINGSK